MSVFLTAVYMLIANLIFRGSYILFGWSNREEWDGRWM